MKPSHILAGVIATCAIVYYFGRRFFEAGVEREEFSLLLHPVEVDGDLALATLNEALTGRGYQLRFFEGGGFTEPAPMSSPLSGLVVRMRDRRLGYGSVSLRLPTLPVAAPTWASVEVEDTTRGAYEELALHLIYELGRLIPSTEWKRSFSVLSLETTDSLAFSLPDAPHHVPR